MHVSEDYGATELRPRRVNQVNPPASAVPDSMPRNLVDAAPDGLMVADVAGTLVLANRRLGDMFGYDPAELVGSPVEMLFPAGLRPAHRGYVAAHTRSPLARPMVSGPQLVALRKDRTTFLAQISLSPVPAEGPQFTVAVIREATQLGRFDGESAHAAGQPAQNQAGEELNDAVVRQLFLAGRLLQTAADLPADAARQRTARALEHLEDTIRQIRDAVFGMSHPARCRPLQRQARFENRDGRAAVFQCSAGWIRRD
jgi:PAS domain S-box-containing protein